MFQQNIALGPGTEAFSSHLIEIIIMLLGAAILGFIIGWLFRKTYKDVYFSMKEDHDKCPGIKAGLEQNISHLEADLRNTGSELETAKGKISSQYAEIENLKSALNEKSAELEKSGERVVALEKKEAQFLAQAEELQTSLKQSKESLAKLESDNAGLIKQLNIQHDSPQKGKKTAAKAQKN